MVIPRIALLMATMLGWPAGASELAAAAFERTQRQVTYDPAYVTLAYPNGDVADDRGVCTDLVIRAYRTLGIDLQQLVHEDMKARFDDYPNLWGLDRPDSNIDHRRVPNLETFFDRHGERLPIAEDPDLYAPGDLVTWRLPGNVPHIGVVAKARVPGTRRHMIIHNIGQGPKQEDILFAYEVVGHYRFGN